MSSEKGERSLFNNDQLMSDEPIQMHKCSEGEIQIFIRTHSLVWRFCAYGAIKNLQFFEAYLMLILLEWGYDLFQIGLLSSVVAGITYVFEVPSGMIADHFGKKNELLASFGFYMVSFGLYAAGEQSFAVLVGASAFYGLGEAFRSGTHKAMILVWLDRHGLAKYKKFVYSRTRSFSNLGSALNAVLSVFIVVFLRDYRLVFAISVVPFVADFVLVATYPSYMNEGRSASSPSCGAILADTCAALVRVMATAETRRPLLSSASFMAVFKTLKHYVQPIMVVYGAAMLESWGVSSSSSSSSSLSSLSPESGAGVNPHRSAQAQPQPSEQASSSSSSTYIKVLVGGLYAVFYLCSAVGTRHSWRLRRFFGRWEASDKVGIDCLFNLMLVVVVAIGLAIHFSGAAAGDGSSGGAVGGGGGSSSATSSSGGGSRSRSRSSSSSSHSSARNNSSSATSSMSYNTTTSSGSSSGSSDGGGGGIAAVLPLYLVLYVVMNLWKPWSVAAVSELMGKDRRATILSVDSLLKTLLEFALAPLVGYVAHTYSIDAVFLGLGGLFLVVNNLLLVGGWGERKGGGWGVRGGMTLAKAKKGGGESAEAAPASSTPKGEDEGTGLQLAKQSAGSSPQVV